MIGRIIIVMQCILRFGLPFLIQENIPIYQGKKMCQGKER
jgi:hypothetical protein